MTAFELAPTRKTTQVWQWLILSVAPVIVLALLFMPEFRSDWRIALPMGALLILTSVGIGLFSRRRRIELEQGQLTIAATFYTRRHAVDALDLDQARIFSLDEHPERRPLMKINGFAIPGFMAGHFRTKQWNKVFCLVTHPKVILLPLRDSNAAVLLSPARPQALLDALRQA
ncbi:MAG: PH domain-containing protein [Pseudomonadota bacterium]